MKVEFKHIIHCIIFCFAVHSAKSNEYVMFYSVDSTSQYSIEDVQNFKWHPVAPDQTITLGYNNNATVWCKLELESIAHHDNISWVFNNIHLDSLCFYANSKILSVMGDRTSESNDLVKHYYYRLSEIKDYQPDYIIASVKKQWSFIDFSMSIKDTNILKNENSNSLALAFSFIGCSIMLLVFNIYMYYRTKQRKFTFYIAYSSIGMIYVLVNMGVAKYYFLPSFLYFSEIRIFSGCYWYLFLGFFLAEILQLKKHLPIVFKGIISFQWIVAILSIISICLLITHNEEWIIYPSYFIYLLFFVNITLLTYAVIFSKKNKHPWANYVIVSFVPHIFWGLQMIFTAFQIVHISVNIDWISIIIFYEMLLFGWILIQDYVNSYRRNQILQTRLIEEERKTIISIEKARINERRLIADILHDKIGTDLAQIGHYLELNKNNDVKISIQKLGSEIRNLSHTILPKSLEDGALVDALSTQLEIISTRQSETSIEFNKYDFPEQIHPEIAISMYLISLEIIQNTLKHSQAKNVLIEFYKYPEEFVFSFEDDGCGFNPKKSEGFGIINCRRRISNFGGNFNLHSNIDKGTSILITLPT